MKAKILSLIIVINLFVILSGITTMQNKYNHKIQQEKHHKFDDVEKWEERFENSERDKWQKPNSVIDALDLSEDDIIVDIGSATGYFPVRFAKALPQGKVYGIDIESKMVDYLNERAQREGFSNLTSLLGKPHDPMIPEPVDIVFICNTYHHIEQRLDYFSKLKRNFKEGGRLVIVDFRAGDLPVGPPDEMKLSEKEVISELFQAGYTLIQNSEILPYQYFLIFSPK